MIFLKTFLVNLACAFIPCSLNFGTPEIVQNENRFRRDFIPPIVSTDLGKIEGFEMESSNGGKIIAFEGVPYAEPPINDKRFKAAEPKKPWSKILQAKNGGVYCLQLSASALFRVIGQEDCLYLNIYTPELPGTLKNETSSSDELRPVIIWIHGGAFLFGSGGEYGPTYMLDQNIVLVTINYRLGVLGFLSTGDRESSGNYGLKDQSLAISFIHQNIKYFGGDPSKITLMGQSAGGVSVHLQLLSNYMSKKLIKSAISMSGNAFSHWAIRSQAQGRSLAKKIGKLFRCETEDSKKLVKCLKDVNPVFLVAAQLNLFEWLPFPVVLFSPVVEDVTVPDAFITQTPDEIYDQKINVAKIPLITSITSSEGFIALVLTDTLLRTQTIRTEWEEYAPLILDFKGVGNVNGSSENEITGKIYDFYFKENGLTPRNAPLEVFSQIASDRYFNFAYIKALQRHSQLGLSTYGYIFNYKGKYGLENALGYSTSRWGIGHAEDVFYYFNSSSIFPGFKQNDPEKKMSKIMINLITNFASKSVPYYTDDNKTDIKIWSSIKNPKVIEVLQLSNDVKMVPGPFLKNVRFWQSLGLRDMKPFIYI